MNVLISTTTQWNPGDDFIREGMINLLPELRGHNIQYLNRSQLFPDKKIEENVGWCDLYLHAGTPDWLHRHDFEYSLLQKQNKPYAFIGVGNPGGNQKFENYKDWLIPTLTNSLCLAVIVRDKFTSDALSQWQIPHKHFPCPALFVFPENYAFPFHREIIGLGCYCFNAKNHLPNDKAEVYFRLFKVLEAELFQNDRPILFICHTLEEYKTAKRLFRSPCFYSCRWEDYLPVYASLNCYVGSRVHGAITAASALVPAFHLGIDQRIETCEEYPTIINKSCWDVTAKELIRFVHVPRNELHPSTSANTFKSTIREKYSHALLPVRKYLEEC